MNKMKKSEIIDNLKTILIVAVISIIVRIFLFNIVIVKEHSMFPTLKPNDILISSRISVHLKNYKKGDIIVFKRDGEKKQLVKRIIASPKDEIEIKSGKVYVNGNELEEKYLDNDIYTYSDMGKIKLSDDEYFVMGDNREVSMDSRYFGPIKKGELISKPVFRIFPIKTFGSL